MKYIRFFQKEIQGDKILIAQLVIILLLIILVIVCWSLPDKNTQTIIVQQGPSDNVVHSSESYYRNSDAVEENK